MERGLLYLEGDSSGESLGGLAGPALKARQGDGGQAEGCQPGHESVNDDSK